MSARPSTQTAPAAAERLLSPRFLRVTVANFFFFLTFASFFLLPLHVRALGGSERAVGLVMGTAGLAGLAGVLAIGPLLDRLDRRLFLRGGLAAMSVTAVAFVLVDRIGPGLLALRVVQGLAFAAVFNAASTLAAEFAPPGRRAAAFGFFGVSTLATHALAPSLGELLVRVAGFRALFLAAAGYSAIGLAVAWSVPGTLPHRGQHADVPLRATRPLAAAVVTVALCGVAFGAVLTYVPTFVKDESLGPVATFFLCYTAAAIATRLAAGGLSDALGRASVIVPALGLLVVAILALAATRSALALAGAGALFGTAQGILYPTLNAFAIDQTEPGQLGRAQTLYNGAFNLGTTTGSMALGAVAHAHGHRAVFLCAAAAAAAALAAFGLGTRAARGGRSIP